MALHAGPRIVVLAPDQASVRDLGAVPDDLHVRIATDWESFERYAGTSHIMAVVLPELVGPDFDALVGARLRFWSLPLVLLTRTDRGSLLQLRHVNVEEVVPWDERQTSFWRVLRHVSPSHLRQRLVSHIRRSFSGPRRVIEIFESVLLADPPWKTVSALASSFFIVTGALRYRWRKHVEDVNPKDLVSWGILLKAIELWPLLRSWKEVAHALGIDLRTLESYAEKLMDASLEELEQKPPAFVLNRFHEEVLAHIDWA